MVPAQVSSALRLQLVAGAAATGSSGGDVAGGRRRDSNIPMLVQIIIQLQWLLAGRVLPQYFTCHVESLVGYYCGIAIAVIPFESIRATCVEIYRC